HEPETGYTGGLHSVLSHHPGAPVCGCSDFPNLRGGELLALKSCQKTNESRLDHFRTVIICRVAVKRMNVIGAVADWRVFNHHCRTLDAEVRAASVACCAAPCEVRIR